MNIGPAGAAETSLLDALRNPDEFFSAELRPPRANAPVSQSMGDWIDTYHAIRRLTLAGTNVFITDNAIGQPEEENLRHLVANLGQDARPTHIIPFLTSKHTLEYCLRYAERAYEHGFRTLVVLGGDRHDGVPRCVKHGFELRAVIRKRVPGMLLGGWANPHSDSNQQASFLADSGYEADFFLTQIVSQYSERAVESFLNELEKRAIRTPAIFGVFYYRSARKSSLEMLAQFFPVPARQLQKAFEEDRLHPDLVCARSIRRLRELGVRRFYISNLPVYDAAARLATIARLSAEGESGGRSA